MKQAVIRQTLTNNAWTAFTFTGKGRTYFVKNYTESDIYVSFENNDSENESFKIASGMGEEVAISFDVVRDENYFTNVIYVKGTGEVEVQQMDGAAE